MSIIWAKTINTFITAITILAKNNKIQDIQRFISLTDDLINETTQKQN